MTEHETIDKKSLSERDICIEFTNEVVGRVAAKLEVWKGLRR